MRRSSKIAVFVALAAATTASVALAERASAVTDRDGRTVVKAPGTRVAVVPKQTKVHVTAPYTSVKVDTSANSVRIRVPYFNGDINW